jgi:EmrB/QacA subfamily drug resistance transporter
MSVETASPPAPTSRSADRARWFALALLATTQFVLILDAAIVGVAMPSIATDLDLSQSDLTWIANAYTLLFGGFLLLGGRLADLLGRRRLFVGGLVLFTAASLIAGLADSGLILVGARALQGFAAALVSPAALSLVMTLFKDGAERNKALGILGAVAGSGAAAGLVLGGILTDWFGWASVFYVNVPIGIAAVLLAFRLLPRSGAVDRSRGFDLAGATTVTGGLALLVYVLVNANDAGWLSVETLGLGALSLALLAAFVVIEMRVEHPLVPLRFFAAPLRRGANVVAVLTTMAMFPMFFFITLYTQQVLGYSPIESGLAQLPFALTIIVVASSIGPVIARLGLRTTAIAGLALMTVGLAWISRLPVDGTFLGDLLGPMLVIATGAGLAFISMMIAATNSAAEHEAGLASGLINTAQQVGGALGLGVLVAVATTRTESVMTTGEPVAVALTEGFQIGLLVGAGIALAGAVAAAVLLPREAQAAESEAELAIHQEPVPVPSYE